MTQQKRIEKLEIEHWKTGKNYFTDNPIERDTATKAGHDPDKMTHHQALKCGCSGWLASHYPDQFDLSDKLIQTQKAYDVARDLEQVQKDYDDARDSVVQVRVRTSEKGWKAAELPLLPDDGRDNSC